MQLKETLREVFSKTTIWLVSAVVVLGICFVGCPIYLHYELKAHNSLIWSVRDNYSTSKTIKSGEVYAATLRELLKHELDAGWQPNDLFNLSDNLLNHQLGTLNACRESLTGMRNYLTKVSSDEYDRHLKGAETAIRVSETSWMMPSFESQIELSISELNKYIKDPSSKPLNHRNEELVKLLQCWTDLLGDAFHRLEKQTNEDGSAVSFFQTDDLFYYAQGEGYVTGHLLEAIQREYASDLKDRPRVVELFKQASNDLLKASTLKPYVVLNGSLDSIRANHRSNLAALISSAKMNLTTAANELRM